MVQILPAAIKKVEAVFTPTASKDVIDPEAILKELSSEEKIALLSGDDMWHTAPVKRLGVPRVRVSLGRIFFPLYCYSPFLPLRLRMGCFEH